MLRKFVTLFLSKLPDRLSCLIIIVCIVTLGSFAYETVGLPIQTASAQATSPADNAATAAISWVNAQNTFVDRINHSYINTSSVAADNGAYHVTVDFTSLEYKVDRASGGIHHIPVNHTISMMVDNGKVMSAIDGIHDLMADYANSPLADVSRDYS